MGDKWDRRLTPAARGMGQRIEDCDGAQHAPAKRPSAACAVAAPPPSPSRYRHHTIGRQEASIACTDCWGLGNRMGFALLQAQTIGVRRRHAAPLSERGAAVIALSKRAQT